MKSCARKVLAVSFFLCLGLGQRALAQSDTVGEFWPTLNLFLDLPQEYRVTAFAASKKGEEFPYEQVYAGVGFGKQWKPIVREHVKNLDSAKEHVFGFGGGYERVQTVQSGKESYENRLALQLQAGYRLNRRLLVSDRNRVEFRWVNGAYSTRYRNQATGLYDITVHGFHFSPYASAEFFFDGASNSWNEERYTGGFEWPFRKILMLQTYYLRQNCDTCNPQYLNVGGLTVNLFF
jgi:Protein of unknown function (DUF2490)